MLNMKLEGVFSRVCRTLSAVVSAPAIIAKKNTARPSIAQVIPWAPQLQDLTTHAPQEARARLMRPPSPGCAGYSPDSPTPRSRLRGDPGAGESGRRGSGFSGWWGDSFQFTAPLWLPFHRLLRCG